MPLFQYYLPTGTFHCILAYIPHLVIIRSRYVQYFAVTGGATALQGLYIRRFSDNQWGEP